MSLSGAVYGLEAPPLPDGWTPLEAVTVVKCLDADGSAALVSKVTDGLSMWECVGMLSAVLDSQRADIQRCFIDPDDEEDEP